MKIVSWQSAISTIAMVISFCFFLVIYQSYFPHHPPINSIDTKILSVTKTPSAYELKFERNALVNTDTSLRVETSIYNQATELTIDLPSTHRLHIAGKHKIVKLVVLPISIPTGEYVYKTNIIWQPIASLEEHYFSFPDVPFTIK